jgi:hypothetical protein
MAKKATNGQRETEQVKQSLMGWKFITLLERIVHCDLKLYFYQHHWLSLFLDCSFYWPTNEIIPSENCGLIRVRSFEV